MGVIIWVTSLGKSVVYNMDSCFIVLVTNTFIRATNTRLLIFLKRQCWEPQRADDSAEPQQPSRPHLSLIQLAAGNWAVELQHLAGNKEIGEKESFLEYLSSPQHKHQV